MLGRGGAAVGVIVLAVAVVLAARWLRSLDGVGAFIERYPGSAPIPGWTPIGLPAWLGWQHFANLFFLVLIVRSGWLVRTTKRPAAYWTRTRGPRSSHARKISLELWLHLSVDALWLANGALFVVLLFSTGQWARIVPTSWEVFPNAVSAALQYASMNWPLDDGWTNYNALQQLSYFATVFLAAPLAAITGIRMSGAWPVNAQRLNRGYPIEWARAVHFPVMIYFVAFTVVHVVLVFSTGALRNLNHMFTARDATDWWGVAVFALALLVTIAAVMSARAVLLAPLARSMGKISR